MIDKLSALITFLVFAGLWWVAVLVMVLVLGTKLGIMSDHGLMPAVWVLFLGSMLWSYVTRARRGRLEDFQATSKWEYERQRAADSDWRPQASGETTFYQMLFYLPDFAIGALLAIFERSDEE